jgi:hypothetical protein
MRRLAALCCASPSFAHVTRETRSVDAGHPRENQEYFDGRLTGQQSGYLGYYDRTARRMKRRHLQTRSAATIGAVLIAVVSNLTWEPHIGGIAIHVETVGASLIGLAVALILALEGVFHFKEQWQNFRGTEQYLLSQKYRFENGVDEYQALSTEDAFQAIRVKG